MDCQVIHGPGGASPQCADPKLVEALTRVHSMAGDLVEIKTAMRDMAAAISRLAVMEERQIQDRDHITRLFKLTDSHNERITDLEKAEPLQKQTSEWVNKAMTVVMTAVLTALVGLVVIKTSAPAAPTVLAAPK